MLVGLLGRRADVLNHAEEIRRLDDNRRSLVIQLTFEIGKINASRLRVVTELRNRWTRIRRMPFQGIS